MSVLIFIDHSEGHVKKASLEAMSYGAALASQLGVAAEAILLGTIDTDPATMGRYGVKKVYHAAQESLNHLDSQVSARIVADTATTSGATVLVFSNNVSGKAIAPRVAARLKAGLVSGALAMPDTTTGFIVRKNVFSGKAFANVSILTPVKVIALNPNSYPITEGNGNAEMAPLTPAAEPRVKFVNASQASGQVPLTEAELVVSGGRGLKGPENWGMIEDLARALGAATACSRPVADAHWRPHNEHVGQTGIAIAPNLYIAIGISGAIQHLAGVNRSKVIVVVNKDPEAPFFKAADYGIVGDAFEVVPKMTEAVKKLKGIA
ncbi:MAG TPA: electron transfer flavoprotein subunit alpha/FixB family protein [Puia sp.]|nr:electron transfer flavoprotein subunit alpha/FixB family protein [Puia sp.]